MHFRKKQSTLSVLEAVDSLSVIAELNASAEKERVEPEEFVEEMPEEHLRKRSWYNSADFSFNMQKVKETFNTLYEYLKNIYDSDEDALNESHMQKGIQALMLLSMEAATNLEKYLEQFPEGKSFEKVTEWEEYKQLQQFYLNIIVPKMQNKLEQIERWQEDWGVGLEDEESLGKKRGIEDLEGIRHDKDYELFLIKREDGRPFFTRVLLRHMHLVQQFDGLLVNPPEEDPLSKIRYILDRDLHLTAKDLLHSAAPYIDEFYRMGTKHKDMQLVATMSKALMALMLAANPRNLLHTTLGKCCLNYFADFYLYFRTLISSIEYQRFFERAPPTSERLSHCLINLSHALSVAFFMRQSSLEDLRSLIRALIERGSKDEEVQSPTHSPLTVWNTFLDEDEEIRVALKYSPYGPLHNAILVFTEKRQLKGFDPLFQFNFPYTLYSATNDKISFECVHFPCPTFQDNIKKAEVVGEFHVFLRALNSGKRNQRHLIINLQDRTSWQEYARCNALEELQKKNEYEEALKVVTLATGTDFYRQSGPFAHLDQADLFIDQCKQQLETPEECGFYLPEEIKNEEWRPFVHEALHAIHELFFGAKEVMVHKNRLDFIEIFYQFLILKCIERIKPDSISFTSKDSVDSGAAFSAEFYGFLRMMNSKESFSEAEKEFMRSLFYAPALLVRQRVIDAQNFKRAISALSIINAELEAHYSKVVSSSSKLFRTPFFKGLTLKSY